MRYPIEEKLVVGVASSALFDLSESNGVLEQQGVAAYRQHQQTRIDHPLADLFKKLSHLQQLERELLIHNPQHTKILSVSIVTARGAPAHERVLTTLRDWGVETDEAFFLGGMEKLRILQVLKPHIFFDDQLSHLHAGQATIPMVHIPFGVANPVTE